jgi:hypothetical protein
VIDELRRELGAVGIRGRLRRRILDEFRDHLTCDAHAELGDPRTLARQFADELGTTRSRRAAFAAFAGLAVAGIAYTAAFAASAVNAPSPVDMHARTPFLGWLAAVAVVLAPQVAFVTGSLAALRAFRRRRERAVPARDVQILVRRTGLALAAGLATMAAIGLYAYEYGVETGIAYVGAAVGGGALLLATAPVLSALRVRPSAPGEPDDVIADLGVLVPEPLRGDPWRFARAVAVLAGGLVWAAGIVLGDPIDGLFRGVVEAVACLGGFAVLGRYLGLRV